MKPFNQTIVQAKKRQQGLNLLMLGGFVLLVVIILTALLISRGTRIIVQPEAALPASIYVEQGLGMALFGSVYSLTASPTIRITADRYYPHQQILQPAEQGQVLTGTYDEALSNLSDIFQQNSAAERKNRQAQVKAMLGVLDNFQSNQDLQ